MILVPLFAFLVFYQNVHRLDPSDTVYTRLIEILVICFLIYYIAYWLTYSIKLDHDKGELQLKIFGITFYDINIRSLKRIDIKTLYVYPSDIRIESLIPRGSSVTKVYLYYNGNNLPIHRIWKITSNEAIDLLAEIQEINNNIEINTAQYST